MNVFRGLNDFGKINIGLPQFNKRKVIEAKAIFVF